MEKKDPLYNADELISLSSLAGGIAHDYNNILTVILGNVTLGKSIGSQDEEFYEILDSIKNAGEEARKITEILMSFAKNTDILIQEESPVQLISEVFHDAPIHGMVRRFPLDKVLFYKALVQIEAFFNAYSSEKGTIQVYIEEKEKLIMQFSQKNLVLSEEEWQDALNTHFSLKKKDYGISLLVSYFIIKKHNGTMDIRTLPEEGTIITIKIPGLPSL